MKIIKESQGGQETEVSPEDLALINQLARKELKAEEVYTFSVRLCDDQVDRDFERFSPQTLEELAGLFVARAEFLTTSGPPGGSRPGSIRRR